MTTALDLFHPLIREWFSRNLGSPTDVQEQAWPLIAKGGHVLACASTGSGKTLTAFLWALNQLAAGHWETGTCRVLYISPLKALNTDIRENLLLPLRDIRRAFEDQGLAFPAIRVMTRSGDTPQKERRHMAVHPPEILITTPESLNLLLSSRSGLHLLGQLKTVILDEIHACAGTKRGVHLITAVDRLVRLSGEFQRIALSATLKDAAQVLEMVGGYVAEGAGPRYRARDVDFVRALDDKKLRIRVCFPEKESGPEESGTDAVPSPWERLARAMAPRIAKNRSTLIFTNGRRLCEKLTFEVNRAAGGLAAFSHHGSLSRELRQEVEKKLKKGELSAIVATASLEMGIDIGSLDEVIMVQSPPLVSSAIQRLGRAGHAVGQASCGTLFPAHAQDLIPSAVLARAVADRDIEPLKPVAGPLDVLAQVLVSMVGTEDWDLDDLFAFIRTSAPYRHLDRERFDLVVNMLAGRWAQTRIRDLAPKIRIDRLENRATAAKGALLTLYMSGGTIPDRGYFALRHARTRARIGELDEEYVWEAKKGQIATVGSQNWQITEITHNDVFALPAGPAGLEAPFWIAESQNRDPHFSLLIRQFLSRVQTFLEQGKSGEAMLEKILWQEYSMDDAGARALISLCRRQMQAAALPHDRCLVLEFVDTGPGGNPGRMLVIHTLWGGCLNRPFALALGAAWEKEWGETPEIFPGNDAVVVQLPEEMDPDQILTLVRTDNLLDLVRQSLAGSSFFGARFRESAGRALLVTRHRINQRMPLWMTRLKSQKLLENILSFPDFPILLETWRTCLEDEFDLDALLAELARLASGDLAVAVAHTRTPSPFAAALAWPQINQYMYRQDQGASKTPDPDLMADLLTNEALRPKLPGDLIAEFELKRQRLAPGYRPENAEDLLDWVRERLALPWAEWEALTLGATREKGGTDHPEVLPDPAPILAKLVLIRPPGLARPLVAALENARDLVDAWYSERAEILDLAGNPWAGPLPRPEFGAGEPVSGAALLGQWLSFYGPVSLDFPVSELGVTPHMARDLIEDLTQGRNLISGTLVRDAEGPYICDAGNYEILVRRLRSMARTGISPVPLSRLPLFLARVQGLTRAGQGTEDLFQILSRLSCLALPWESWETQVLPARLSPYYPAFLDSLMVEGDLIWQGREKQQVLFCLAGDQDLLDTPGAAKDDPVLSCFIAPGQRHTAQHLAALTGFGPAALYGAVWEKVWQGRLSCDNVLALRKGAETRFAPAALPGAGALGPGRTGADTGPGAGMASRWAGIRGMGRERRPARFRSGTGRGAGSALLPGLWFVTEQGRDWDRVEAAEVNRERVRLLLDRYGILFRELLARELSGFRWKDLFKTLYLMELSGEVVGGAFFEGIEGPQFASRKALPKLQSPSGREVFWLSAADPASACGLGPVSAALDLPRRLPGNLLVFQGEDLKLACLGQGRELIIHAAPDDPDLPLILGPLQTLLTRQVRPLTRISVATINGRDAAKSPFRAGLESLFDAAAGLRTLDLFKKI